MIYNIDIVSFRLPLLKSGMTICRLPERTRRACAMTSKVRSKVEHVFAHQKGSRALAVRTIGLARAKVKIGLANLAYNMRRSVWPHARAAAG